MKNGSYVIYIDENRSLEIHWIELRCNGNTETNFEKFADEFIPKEIKKFTGNKNITTNIYRTQAYDSIICKYFCIGFIDFMFKDKGF